MELHDIIRKLRQKKDLTQENIAFELGVDKTTIGRYEKDASSVKLEQLEKLARLFGMNVPQMLSYEDEVENSLSDPVSIYGKKGIRILIELDGTDEGLKFWFGKLTKINAAI